jgi:hypothetical protein
MQRGHAGPEHMSNFHHQNLSCSLRPLCTPSSLLESQQNIPSKINISQNEKELEKPVDN